jgi:hypothetical protein
MLKNETGSTGSPDDEETKDDKDTKEKGDDENDDDEDAAPLAKKRKLTAPTPPTTDLAAREEERKTLPKAPEKRSHKKKPVPAATVGTTKTTAAPKSAAPKSTAPKSTASKSVVPKTGPTRVTSSKHLKTSAPKGAVTKTADPPKTPAARKEDAKISSPKAVTSRSVAVSAMVAAIRDAESRDSKQALEPAAPKRSVSNPSTISSAAAAATASSSAPAKVAEDGRTPGDFLITTLAPDSTVLEILSLRRRTNDWPADVGPLPSRGPEGLGPEACLALHLALPPPNVTWDAAASDRFAKCLGAMCAMAFTGDPNHLFVAPPMLPALWDLFLQALAQPIPAQPSWFT